MHVGKAFRKKIIIITPHAKWCSKIWAPVLGRKWFVDVQLYEIIIQYKTKQDGKLENVGYHQCNENQNGFPLNESRIRPYRLWVLLIPLKDVSGGV